MITTALAAASIANTLMPPTRSTPADDHHCTSGSKTNQREKVDPNTGENPSRRAPLHERQENQPT
jgi:hypothetical protein